MAGSFSRLNSTGRGEADASESAQPQAASPPPGRIVATLRSGSTVFQRIGRDGKPVGGPPLLEILHFDPDDLGIWADIP